MAEKNPMAPCPDTVLLDPDLEALSDEALVLDRLLVRWPIHLQEGDLQRELELGEDAFEHRDRVERAVHQLHWAGLALACGPVVIPTRAALQYHLLSTQTSIGIG